MTKQELIKHVADATRVAQIGAVGTVNAVIEVIAGALVVGEDVKLPLLGTFRVKATKARTGRNPKTGETVEIPAGKKIVFKAAKELKSKMEGGE